MRLSYLRFMKNVNSRSSPHRNGLPELLGEQALSLLEDEVAKRFGCRRQRLRLDVHDVPAPHERQAQHIQQYGGRSSDIRVRELMTPHARLEVLPMAEVAR